MTVRFYNTLSRSSEIFVPVAEGEVKMYCCGPTIYNFAHIGNLRTFVFYDFLRRYLRYRGYKVTFAMNITDVDDKTIRKSVETGKPLKEITDYYLEAFVSDLKALKVELPDIMPRATEEVGGMVDMIKILIEKGHAYQTENGDVYFRISSFDKYGQLAGLDLSKLKEGASGRTNAADEYEKEDASDFALWKAWDEDDGDVFWKTDLGKGRPGWHIECSEMSSKYLGQPIDIHCGAEDLIFPHHTNEIAQSECALGEKFVNYWLHPAHLVVNGRKMSKSLGNFYTLRDLLDEGLDPSTIRYELLKTHYRQQLDFRKENLAQGKQILDKFVDFEQRLGSAGRGDGWADCEKQIKASRDTFTEAMDNDLNISEGLAAVFAFMTAVNRCVDELSQNDVVAIRSLMQEFDSVLCLMPQVNQDADPEIEALIEERLSARKNKDYARADQIRDELAARGIVIKDTADGTVWKRG